MLVVENPQQPKLCPKTAGPLLAPTREDMGKWQDAISLFWAGRKAGVGAASAGAGAGRTAHSGDSEGWGSALWSFPRGRSWGEG